MNNWPIDIPNHENIVRGVCSPYHVNSKGKLKPEAYDPTQKTDEVSVMRSDWIGSHQCKQQAKNLENLTQEKPKIYKGLAVLSAEEIRNTGADIIDSRKYFIGHADLKHNVPFNPGEPLPSESTKIVRERNKILAKVAHYLPDQNPTSDIWHGPDLIYSTLENLRHA